MTNEELEVLAGLAMELREKREDLQEAQEQRDRFVNRTNCLDREKNDLMAECNRLRESEANALNALNAAEEAKRRLQDAEDCLKKLYWRYRINKGSPVLKFIREYAEKYSIEIVEVGMNT